jgi:hypothetical protein
MVRRHCACAFLVRVLTLLVWSHVVLVDVGVVVTAAAAVTAAIPPFALKLIVVETDPAVWLANTTEFRAMLNNVTSDYLSRALTLSLVTAVNVTTTMEEYKYEVFDNGVTGGDVLLAVAFAGFQGSALYDGVEVGNNISELVYTALSQETGFWDLAKAMVNNDLLKAVAKLQIAADNRIVAEGNLVPGVDTESNEEEPEQDDVDEDSSFGTGLIIILTVCSIVSVLVVVGGFLLWRCLHEQYLERKKAERRRMARRRRMMENDRSSTFSNSFNLNSSCDNSSLKKPPTKTHKKPVISKPSQEAKKEKRLLRIIEQNEEEGSDEEEDKEVSYQSCQSSLTSLTCSPQKLAQGWNEHDVPDYMRNTRGFHSGSVPVPLPRAVSPTPILKQPRNVSPTPIKPHVDRPAQQQKLRAPATWENRTGAHDGSSTSLEKKFDPNSPNQAKKTGTATPSQINRMDVGSARGGILETQESPRAKNVIPTLTSVQDETRNTGNESVANLNWSGSTGVNQYSLSSSFCSSGTPPLGTGTQQPARFTGHESMANLNWSGSTMSNQHSLSASVSTNSNQMGEMFHNDGPPTPVQRTHMELSKVHDSVSYNDDVAMNFNMSMANFDIMDDDDSALFEDASRGQEAMTFDEFSQDVGLDRPSQHSFGGTSSSLHSRSSSKQSPKTKLNAASWRFT